MKLLNKAVELSKPVQELAEAIKQLAQGLEKVARSVASLSQNQEAHHRMIVHLHLAQQVIMRRLAEGGTDTSLPEIDDSGDKKAPTKKSN